MKFNPTGMLRNSSWPWHLVEQIEYVSHISIHALREGRDGMGAAWRDDRITFQSTRSIRGATAQRSSQCGSCFNPRASSRGAMKSDRGTGIDMSSLLRLLRLLKCLQHSPSPIHGPDKTSLHLAEVLSAASLVSIHPLPGRARSAKNQVRPM